MTDGPLVQACRQAGVSDPAILAAVDGTDRAAFLPASERGRADLDKPLPIAEGQTTSQPSLIARMLEVAELDPKDRVMEIGTGSGYQTALLAQLCAEVVSVERHASLAAEAEGRLTAWPNVSVHVGDGTQGWPSRAPYQAIVVSAVSPKLPPPLADQLAPGGRIVLPIAQGRTERVVVYRRRGSSVTLDRRVADVRFVPLIGDDGYADPGSDVR